MRNINYTFDGNGNLTLQLADSQPDSAHCADTMGTRVKNHIWDEENRLLAINDNGFISNYFYDAAGERTVKLSKPDLFVYVNSSEKLKGDSLPVKFVGYVSPYLVVTNGGRYTKHIYAGTQRIASKLGDINAFGADPRRVAKAGHDVDNAEPIDFGTKYKNQNDAFKARFDSLGSKFNGKTLDDYVNGKSFCCGDKNLDEIEKNNTQTAENAKLEDNLYFYHLDHLGSTSMVTNYDGEATQNVAYIPYGEVFVEERNGSWVTPFLFNAKELDEETGLYYYGARYLNPTDCRWLSTDPMQGKYPGMSPYNYCAGNPVKLVDPDGRELGVNVDGETYTYNPEIKVNKYTGKKEKVANFVSKLNKINSTKIGHKLLKALHKSDKKYVITNENSKKGTKGTVKTKDGAKNKMGDSAKLIELSHELFHSYQFEMGQGGASIFNEIEAYIYSNRLINEYNKNISDDDPDYYAKIQQTDNFMLSYDFLQGKPLSSNSIEYENAVTSLVYGDNFDTNDFNTAWANFRAYSGKKDVYQDKLSYPFKLSTNKHYLLNSFFK